MNDVMKIFAALFLLGLAACETAEGFGQDVEDAGEAIEEAAAEADRQM